MVRKNKMRKKRSHFVLPVTIFCVILVAVGLYICIHEHVFSTKSTSTMEVTKPVNSINYAPSNPSDNTANNQRKGSSTDGSTSPSSTLDTPSTTPNFSATISRATGDANGITTAANINGVTSGTCIFSFSMTADGQAVATSQPEPVQTTNQSAACSVTQPLSKGTYYISVSVTNSSSTAVASWAGSPVAVGPQ
jgi:cytoskeletal protein RodZ